MNRPIRAAPTSVRRRSAVSSGRQRGALEEAEPAPAAGAAEAAGPGSSPSPQPWEAARNTSASRVSAARSRDIASPADADSAERRDRRGSARRARRSSRECCVPGAGGGSCRRARRPWRTCAKYAQATFTSLCIVGVMRTFRRLLGFLRPHRRALWGSLVFAWAAMGMTVLIPWLIGEAVNEIEQGRTTGESDALPLLVGAIIAAAVLRVGLTVVRRLVAGRVSLAVEFDLRQRFYSHLQSLELGFFDRQQTGQLMSRATVDLQSIRFFLGYGLIFITQNLLTLVLATAVMLAINPVLALIALAPAPIVILTAARYNRLSRPAVQEVQQRIAELTAEAEENVSGIRIVKAFAREEHQLQRFRRAVT